MYKPPRLMIASLGVSAAAFAALVISEGWTDVAVVPTKGDRWTVGPGLTYRPDGTPVQPGDAITPPDGIKRSLSHIQKDETRLRQCVTSPLSQVEYDLLVDFSYQYGSDVACQSSMVRFTNQGMYREACESYLLYRMAAGYDCSTRIDGAPNKRCWGVWERSMKRRDRCMEAQ
jgi:GH24 family phage-related lysozyme (muramidase)